jgi:hypothetical protein
MEITRASAIAAFERHTQIIAAKILKSMAKELNWTLMM